MNSIKDLAIKLKKSYKRYRTLNHRLDTMTEMKSVLKATFFAILVGLLMVAIPTLIIINMFIYSKLTVILGVLLYVLAITFVYIYYHVYYRLIGIYHEKTNLLNLKYLKYMDFIIVSSVITLIIVIVLIALI